MPTRIVTSTYRYKRPPRKRKAVPLTGPAIVRERAPKPANDDWLAGHAPLPTAGTKSAVVTAKRPRSSRFGDAPDLTTEEHRRRGDAADALFREIVRRATE